MLMRHCIMLCSSVIGVAILLTSAAGCSRSTGMPSRADPRKSELGDFRALPAPLNDAFIAAVGAALDRTGMVAALIKEHTTGNARCFHGSSQALLDPTETALLQDIGITWTREYVAQAGKSFSLRELPERTLNGARIEVVRELKGVPPSGYAFIKSCTPAISPDQRTFCVVMCVTTANGSSEVIVIGDRDAYGKWSVSHYEVGAHD